MTIPGVIFVLLSIAGITVAVTVGISYVFTRWYGTPKRMPSGATPADYGMTYEQVSFTSSGKSLSGWFIPPPLTDNPWPAVVLAHGWSFRASSLMKVARDLNEAGFAVFAYDARGHGDSEEDGFISLVKISEDILSAISYVEGRSDVDDSRIALVGHSIGGAGGIVAASEDPRVRCLVAISAFSDPVEVTGLYLKRYRIPRWPFLWLIRRFIEAEVGEKMAEFAPENRIGRVAVPALLIHGEADRFIPPSNLEAILSNSRKEQVEGWVVPGRRHADVYLDPQFAPRVTDFLRNGLFPEPRDPSADRSSF